MPTAVLVIIIGVVSLIGFSIFISFVPIPLWINALFAGVKVSLASLNSMSNFLPEQSRTLQEDHQTVPCLVLYV